MDFDPEYLAAVTREQDRLIANGIRRAKRSHRLHAKNGIAIVRAALTQMQVELMAKDRADYTPRKPRARGGVAFVTYAAHKARHAAKTA